VSDAFSADQYLPWQRRLAAWIVDSVVFWIAFLPFLLVVTLFVGDLHLEGREFLPYVAAFSLIWEVGWIAGPSSAKPGQRMVDVRIRSVAGGRVPLQRAVIRWAVHSGPFLVVQLGFAAAFVSLMTISLTPRRQALHDLAARTVAVSPAAAGRAALEALPATDPRTAPTPDPAEGNRGPFL
jgi:uncharacterized RDD family membrane protein YckC